MPATAATRAKSTPVIDPSAFRRHSFSTYDFPVRNFPEWKDALMASEDVDHARNVLYCGWQALYDALIDGKVPPTEHMAATRFYKHLTSVYQAFLMDYYMGKGTKALKSLHKRMRDSGDGLMTAPFRLKAYRNVDYNDIYTPQVAEFLKQGLAYFSRKKPDLIIGLACGSSELALPLAGFLDVPVVMVRQSKRRHDSHPKVLPGDQSLIAESANTVCVEDYVCTGHSLASVMRMPHGTVTGICAMHCHDGYELTLSESHTNFYVFLLNKPKPPSHSSTWVD